jgi:hypothetical protein
VGLAQRAAVSIKDRVVRMLALRWLRGKVKGEKMAKVLKALEGWKLVIGVLILAAAGVYDHYNNGSAGSIVAAVLATLGWMPQGVDISQLTGALVVIIGIGGKVIRAQKQMRAGATLAEAGSLVGQAKLAVASGVVQTLSAHVLLVDGKAVDAKEAR